MRSFAALVLIFCGLCVCADAGAQPRNPYGGGTRLPERSELSPADLGFHKTRLALQHFSVCAVNRRPADIQKYLLADLGDAETIRLRNRILESVSSCLEADRMELVPLTLQGALADAMLRQQKLLDQPLDVSVIPPLHHSVLSDFVSMADKRADATALQSTNAMQYLFRFGECVVRADAANARALVKSEPDSVDETAAFGRLMPAFGGCVDKNRTLQGGKIEIRAAVAYNYYRLAAAAHPASLATAGKN